MTAAIPFLIEGAEGLSASEVGVAAKGASELGDDIPSGSIDLGGGNALTINYEQMMQIMHMPQVVQAITERAQGVCDECNATKVIQEAEYEVIVQNRSDTTRARAFVRPANAAAHNDDARNSTMLKAAANAPNDPRQGGSMPNPATPASSEWHHNPASSSAASEGEAALSEGEIAEVAIIAL